MLERLLRSVVELANVGQILISVVLIVRTIEILFLLQTVTIVTFIDVELPSVDQQLIGRRVIVQVVHSLTLKLEVFIKLLRVQNVGLTTKGQLVANQTDL